MIKRRFRVIHDYACSLKNETNWGLLIGRFVAKLVETSTFGWNRNS